jgi:hypothetical protein
VKNGVEIIHKLGEALYKKVRGGEIQCAIFTNLVIHLGWLSDGERARKSA